jgi:hypothetical protein
LLVEAVVVDSNLAQCKVVQGAVLDLTEAVVLAEVQALEEELNQAQVAVVLVLTDSRHQLNGVLMAVVVMAVLGTQEAVARAVLVDLVAAAQAGMMVVLLGVVEAVVDSEVAVVEVWALLAAGVADTLIPITVSALTERRAQVELQETPRIQIAEEPVLEQMGCSLQDQVIQD